MFGQLARYRPKPRRAAPAAAPTRRGPTRDSAPAEARYARASRGVENRGPKFPTVTSPQQYASPLTRIENTFGGFHKNPAPRLPLFGTTEDGATRFSPLEEITIKVARDQLARQRYDKTWKKAAPYYGEAGRKPPKVDMSPEMGRKLSNTTSVEGFHPGGFAPRGKRKVVLGPGIVGQLGAFGPGAKPSVNEARGLLLHEWRHNRQPQNPPLPHPVEEGDAQLFAQHLSGRLYDTRLDPGPYQPYVQLVRRLKKRYGPILQQTWNYSAPTEKTMYRGSK